ncbi:MAG: acyclic terpene utilization AtuA family protein [Burkholderiales bacterium]
MSERERTVRIGGAGAMWGDSEIATPQLLAVGNLDYLVYDYLAETTMAIMARARAKNPAYGYATDFVTTILAQHLPEIARRGIRVVANAGGLNPLACRDAILKLAASLNLSVKVAAVTGDDLLPQAAALRAQGAPLPETLVSLNAYLGAAPIAAALAAGAQIVVTGRCVDSAVVLGPLVHEFGWRWDDYDRLAAGTLAGHVVECGAQATGGLFTDWESVPDWANIGYPLIECAADGSFIVTKAPGTGGLVAPLAVAEQILYEIGDPAAYAMPDVICDLRAVRVETDGPERVRVTGARGRPPGDRLKCSATFMDGYRLDVIMAIRGIDAVTKARKTADALLARSRRLMQARGHADYSAVTVELLGAEALYGPHARRDDTREVVLRIAVRHPDKAALEALRRESTSAGVSMGPGTRGHFGGRSDVQGVVRLASCFAPKADTVMTLDIDGAARAIPHPPSPAPAAPAPLPAPPGTTGTADTRVPLVTLACARSGDKGDASNIGVIARRPEYLPWLRAALTVETVAAHFAHLASGPVTRYELPGLNALNFVLENALDGGGTASLRSDPLGKSFAQMLLDLPVAVPENLAPLSINP